jgi:Domain of unknown function (DUF397)
MAEIEPSGGVWRKSSYSGGGNDCVEVALLADEVGVRDSKNPEAGALKVSARSWRGLLGTVNRD